MPSQVKQFSGIMNRDDSNEVIPLVHHRYAKNLRFKGNGTNTRAEGILGNILVSNPYLPAGNNECMGAFFDAIGKYIYWFNYNSLGNHGLYQYDMSTGTISRVIQVGYNTDGDILSLDPNYPVYAVKMLYGDSTQGNTLYWNNSQRQPCQVNIKKALAGSYGTIKRTYIDVIKIPPAIPPATVYENDNTVTVNNLRKKLFKFKARYVYTNLEKSVWSSQGQLALPVNYADTNIDKDPTKNCRIAVVLPTGDGDVTKIEIAAAVNNGNTFSDYFLVKVIDKVADSIPNNDLTTYRFYNNQAYTTIDVQDSIQLYDLVPLSANALEMLNGNVPIYGAITEGYDKTIVNGTATSSYEAEQTTQPKYVFAVNQSGDSGFGTGAIHIVVVGTITVGDTFRFSTTSDDFAYSAAVATTSDVISGLSTIATGFGYSIVSSDSENLYILKTGQVLLESRTSPTTIAVTDSFVYDRNSRYNYVIAYFDKAGRTIGSLTSNGMNVQTINYTETTGTPNIPKALLSISSRPPTYAYYYQIGRTKNLSKLKKLEWVSDRTYKDTSADVNAAFISIENLNTFIANNPTSKHLAYDFSANDRIRFMKVLSGTVNTVYTDKDFEILGQVFSPTINGTTYTGQFLKIALPTTSGTFDFGTSDFYNYFIEIYTPAQSVSNGLDLDYEFGERYSIGNAGTANAYHQGMLQNQTSDLLTDATFEFTQGDFYYRQRKINVGAEYLYTIPSYEQGIGRTTMAMNYVSQTYADSHITPGSSPNSDLVGFDPTTNLTRYLLKVTTGGPYNFRIKGTINVVFSDFAEVFSYFLIDSSNNVTYLVPPQMVPQGSNTFTFDVTFQMASNSRVFIEAYSEGDFHNSKTYAQVDIKITRQLPFTVGCIDPNFSDYFESAVNSNGRGYIVDVNAAQVMNPTLLRWGLAYQPNTNINQTNRFKPLNFDEIDRGKGQIQIFKVRDRILRVFQERACANVGIYAKFLQDSGNTNILTTTDDIVTKNNVQYYEGHYGLGNQPTSLVSTKNADYFCDPVRGYQCRLSGDGIVPISELYKGQYEIRGLLTKYNFPYLRPNGKVAKILGFYNYFDEEYNAILQGGAYNGNTILDYQFSFNEPRNGYTCFYGNIGNEQPEWALCAEDIVFSWRGGQLYIHNDEGANRKLYGKSFYPEITLVFNDKVGIKKTFDALSYQSNTIWVSDTPGDITTSQPNPQTGLPQISMLKTFDYAQYEGLWYAALKRDINSGKIPNEALVNGDYLKGVWAEIRLVAKTSDFVYLYLPNLKYSISQRNL